MGGYLRFKRTGTGVIDNILIELENAGNLFHHTEQWSDGWPNDGDPSLIDRIQHAVDIAADTLVVYN